MASGWREELGGSKRSVFPVGLGCMGFSWGYRDKSVDSAAAMDVIRQAIDLGVDHFDTADVYGPFTNESLVGRAIRDRRDRVVIASKVGPRPRGQGDVPIRSGRPARAHPRGLRRLARAARRRHHRLYYLHRIDPKVPIEETWGAMGELVAAGKVRYLGVSEASVDELDRIFPIHPVTAVQSELSLWTRDYLTGVVPWCAARGASFVAFAPLGRGFLTGAISSDARFDSDDFRSTLPRFGAEAVAENQRIVASVRSVASRRGVTPAQIALAWVLAQGERVLVIPGTQRRKYLEENVAAADLDLTPEDLEELDTVPAPFGGRY